MMKSNGLLKEKKKICMKILIAADTYLPVINGVVTSFLNLYRELEQMGHDVRILTLSRNHRSYRNGNVWYMGSINLGCVYPDSRFRSFPAVKILDEIVAWKPDIIHTQSELSTWKAAKQISKLTGARIVHTYHTLYEDYTHYFSPNKKMGRFIVARYSQKMLDQADVVIAPTEKVRQLLLEYGVQTPVVTIPTGIELKQFNQQLSVDEKEKLRTQIGIGRDTPLLIYVGRIAREKNIEEIFYLLQNCENSDINLLLIGDGPYRYALERKADELGLKSRIFFTGPVSPSEISKYYHIGNIFVSASNTETQGLTYIEAMACGLPVLCRKDSCLDHVIINGKNGFQYKTADEFYLILRKLLDDKNYADEIGLTAMKTVQESFSSENFAQQVLRVYKDAMDYYPHSHINDLHPIFENNILGRLLIALNR